MAEKDNTPKKSIKPVTAKPVTVAAKRTSGGKPSPTVKPVVKPVAKPVTKPAAKPIAKPTATKGKPTVIDARPAIKPADKPKPIAKPAVKPVAKPVAKPIAKPAAAQAKPKPAAMVKQEAPKRQPKQKPQKDGGKSAGRTQTAAKPKNKRARALLISAVAFVLILALVISIIVGAKSCSSDNSNLSADAPAILNPTTVMQDKPVAKDTALLSPVNPDDPALNNAFKNEYSATTQVGYYSEDIAEVQRVKPVDGVQNGGLPAYPVYGTNVTATKEEKVAIINESNSLTATGTKNAGGGNYKWMDAQGYLYNGTTAAPEPTDRQLYKHTASVGLYRGNVSDDEPAIEKTVTMRPRGYDGYGVTGVYAPAGEVIKIQIPQADMDATGGITVHIGQALFNGQANNIWESREIPRMPHLLNTMEVNKETCTLEGGVYTAYVGSFIGGPLYIRNENVTFTATISGGVRYMHFILGYTTREEYELNARSSAPYFDLEVWNYGVLHSGPKIYAQSFSYDDIYKAALLWEKVSTVTNTNHSQQGIVFLYEPFVAAGAAVAFPGRRSVNCPESWMSSSLNYNHIVTSGAWGNFHEYHHNFQNFGVGYTGEVTNNALNLVSYSLFTKISSARQIASYGAAGLSGWNTYTSATWALQRVISGQIESTNGLAVYATLLHNFGQDAFINTRGANGAAYFNKWASVTHQDFSYYAKLTSAYGGNLELEKTDYPAFVPVSCVYQTGRSYSYDGVKRYITTMQPYVIPPYADFDIDLGKYAVENGQYKSGSIVIPDGFSYKVKSVTKPANGSIKVKDGYNLTYTPDPDDRFKTSGQIIVTLEIKKDDGAFKVDDVDLVLEFEISHEANGMTLERTTYTYTAENMYSDARTAYENGYAGYESSTGAVDQFNPTQNCNTDMWFRPDTEAMHTSYPNDPEKYFAKNNTIAELKGKLFIPDEGRYRIYLRGRRNCALYYSVDGGETFNLGAYIADNGTSAGFRPDDPNTYFDVDFTGEGWVYFKEVLIVENISANMASYAGIGLAEWTEPMFTTKQDESGATHYFDNDGNEVTEDEVSNAQPLPPVIAKNPPYVNAYRSTYKFSDNTGFESDYFYKKEYAYTYSDVVKYDENSTIISYKGGDGRDGTYWFAPENIFNELSGESNRFQADNITKLPITLSVDVGKTVTANRCEITGYNNGYLFYPTRFKILVYSTLEEMEADTDGTSEKNMFADFTQADAPNVAGTADVKFDIEQPMTFRYYKIIITQVSRGVTQFRHVKFLFNLDGTANRLSPDSGSLIYSGDWRTERTPSSFGHVFVGRQNATLSFGFTGSRIGFFSSSAFGRNFEVEIDGVKVQSMALKQDDGAYALVYLTDGLESGKHNVVLKCTGEANIDSLIIYP